MSNLRKSFKGWKVLERTKGFECVEVFLLILKDVEVWLNELKFVQRKEVLKEKALDKVEVYYESNLSLKTKNIWKEYEKVLKIKEDGRRWKDYPKA